MKVLVTGASGFLGTAVVERLCAHDVPHVRCFVRPTSETSRLDRLRCRYPQCSLEYFVGNLTSSEDCRCALDDIDTVFHVAAEVKGAPAALFLNTVVASSRLLEAMQRSSVSRVVLISSMAVYGPLPSRQSVLDEQSPIEPMISKRDPYSQSKIWQESLFTQSQSRNAFELLVLRPGVIYGGGGEELPARLGMKIGSWFWLFGRDNIVPLTYVDNCAEAVVVAGLTPGAIGCYNVVDDDLPTAAEYLHWYKKQVRNIRSIWVPWWLTQTLSKLVENYSAFSQGQLPPVLTPYKSSVTWRGMRLDNRKIKSLGWKQLRPTKEAMAMTLHCLRGRVNGTATADGILQVSPIR